MYHVLLITYKYKVISLVTSCLLQYSTLTLDFKRLKRKRLPIKWQNHPQTIIVIFFFNPFTPRVRYRDIKVILTAESVNEILWCDHSNETSSAVLSHGTIYI